MNQFHLIFKNERNFLVLSVAYTVFLLAMPILFSFASANWIISERGPIEILSIFAWLVVSAQFVFSDYRPRVKLLYGAWLFLRFEISRSGWRSHAGRWLILAGSLFFICKFLDRLPNVLLVEHGISIPPMVDLYCSVFEEGWELLTPIILAWVAWTQKESLAALE